MNPVVNVIDISQITITTVYTTKTAMKRVRKMVRAIKLEDIGSADQILREFGPRDIYTYCDTSEDDTLHCDSLQIGLTWTLFIVVFGDGNDRWFSATFNTKRGKICQNIKLQ